MCVPRYAQRYNEIVRKGLRDTKENGTSVYDTPPVLRIHGKYYFIMSESLPLRARDSVMV